MNRLSTLIVLLSLTGLYAIPVNAESNAMGSITVPNECQEEGIPRDNSAGRKGAPPCRTVEQHKMIPGQATGELCKEQSTLCNTLYVFTLPDHDGEHSDIHSTVVGDATHPERNNWVWEETNGPGSYEGLCADGLQREEVWAKIRPSDKTATLICVADTPVLI